MVYVVVAADKRAETIFAGYSAAIQAYGRPQALRADMAFEAGLAGQHMIDHMGADSFLVGPSTANQVSLSTLPAILHYCKLLAELA